MASPFRTLFRSTVFIPAFSALSALGEVIPVDFSAPGEFAQKFRTVTEIGGGIAGQVDDRFVLDANSRGGNMVGAFLFDTSPADVSAATQSAFSAGQPLVINLSARVAATDSSVAVIFADARNASNQIMAIINLKTGQEQVRFFKDGTLGARSQSAGTQVGANSETTTPYEPGTPEPLPIQVTLTNSASTPTISVKLGALAPVVSTFAAGDIDWANTLVLLRVSDSDASGNKPVELTGLSLDGPAPTAPPAPVFPPAAGPDGNILTVNPGFESGSLNNFSGTYSFTGWVGKNDLFSNHALRSGTIAAGTVTEGVRKILMSWGGFIATNPASRPAVVGGELLELTFDAKTLVRNFPAERLGITPHLDFFDSAGVRLKRVWGPDWQPRVQYTGKDVWESFTVRATAPPNATSVGVYLNVPAGRFVSSTADYTQDRHVEFDNVRIRRIPEEADLVGWRRAPRLVESGKPATLTVHHAAPANQLLRVALVRSSGAAVASSDVPVNAGRFRATPVTVTPPVNLEDGEYRWQISLHASANGPALTTQNIPGVVADQSVSPPPVNGTDFPAEHPRVATMGRIEFPGAGSLWLHWFASEVRVRFSGTSLRILGTINDNGYGGAVAQTLLAVVDEDFANPITVNLAGFNFNVPVVTGLPDGVHTVRLFKPTESDKRVRLDTFRVDSGRGLLRPEPASPRRLEVFGDSVTSGSSASPAYNGYAPLLGRVLDADTHVVSKGGTGVSDSFSGLDILLNYWDNLTFPNAFNAATGLPWDFSRWTPQAVVIAIGHNDQFNDGPANFGARYAQFKSGLRARYPTARIVSLNTLISASLGFFQGAIQPLVDADPLHKFARQFNTWNDSNTAHPPTTAHLAMVTGDELRHSQAEIVEDMTGWGFGSPGTAYQQWLNENFTPEQIAAGDHLIPDVSGIPPLMRYALGGSEAPQMSASFLPVTEMDGEGNLQMTFFRASSDLEYLIETSNDLTVWTTAATNPGEPGETVVWTDSGAQGSRRFARLRVEEP